MKLLYILFLFNAALLFFSCDDLKDNKSRKSSWVDGHFTRNGRFIKGHFRNSVNYSPDAAANRIRSGAYYQRNKYRYHTSSRHRK